ncbi:carbohydrate ABC transporter membrane protein 1, CUT1 family [Agrococcus carbonis]|uniref:Maltose/maltodextrin transport system permease protein n=2 Tax=Agrococcus carbonis TaxID=684552 RepID=A0A1H1MNW6_9MICO|nr:carbohydrate ABC transporter membrane protein 1, CUT1 family [Agrococcus carbonis]
MTTTSAPERRIAPRRGTMHQPPSARVMLVKIALLAIVDAIAVFAMSILFFQESWTVLAILAAVTLLVNVVYLSPGLLPAKYLTPGLIFLAVFQIFVVLYSCYIALTNYGDGHNSTKEDAVAALVSQNTQRVEGSPTYQVQVVEGLQGLGLLATAPDGAVLVGTAEQALAPVDPGAVTMDGDRAVALEGWTSLSMQDVLQRQQEIAALQVPLDENLTDGFLRTSNASQAFVFQSNFVYDDVADTMTDTETDTVYRDLGNGQFETEDGEALGTGWQIFVGLENFLYPFQEPSYGEALVSVTAWTFVYAIASVAITFLLGLFLAITLNDPRMRSRQAYRVLAILPYAFPSFLSALVWLGLLNAQFGFVNEVLFGSADIPWLTDPWLAKVSALLVNVWLGFPYMFLICMGALQSIPDELTEAARVDGASGWQVFRSIKFPLLLVSTAPLLISSFAFNFNNFNTIYLLTGGGPRMAGVSENVGHTDLLITLVYKTAFEGGTRDYGLASALSILIFLIVAIVSAIAFSRTKALEELN